MDIKKAVIRLGIAVAVLFVADVILLFVLASVGFETGSAFGGERFNYRTTIGETLSVRWDANNEADLAGYRIYRTDAPGEWIYAAAAGDTSAKVALLVGGYYEKISIYITAYDGSGNESAASDTISQIYHGGTAVLYGDFNGDGKVDIEDLFLFLLREGANKELESRV